MADVRTGQPSQSCPARPSWCYGTPGIARAGQLAGIATGDAHRQHRYEEALVRCLDNPAQQPDPDSWKAKREQPSPCTPPHTTPRRSQEGTHAC